MHLDLSGKKIIVTGANSGIGFAISESLLKSGASVALHHNSGKKGIELLLKKYKNATAFQADLSETENCISFFEKIENQFGKIDMLVQNAGIFEEHPTQTSNEKWLETWQKTIKINLDAVGILTKLALEHFKKNKEGRIVYIASRAAFRGETEENLAYAASKGGVVSLARTVARSFGKYGITSFILAPGFTKTPMAEEYILNHGIESLINESSIKKLTHPEDISPIVNLIAAGLMDHATGSTIDFNAGSYIH
ncbi:MAG: SDR family oxidoreductase [Bacteroidetes bacterium]|nr:SDR family oxidoreductase [Bacteroidota bacterium]